MLKKRIVVLSASMKAHICAPVVAREARELRKTLQAHYTHLLVHGALQHQIGERLALADLVRAHEAVEQGRVLGNVVVALP